MRIGRRWLLGLLAGVAAKANHIEYDAAGRPVAWVLSDGTRYKFQSGRGVTLAQEDQEDREMAEVAEAMAEVIMEQANGASPRLIAKLAFMAGACWYRNRSRRKA